MSQLEAIKKLDAYRVVEHKMIEEMQSEGIVLEHMKTKARLFLVSNGILYRIPHAAGQ